MNSMPFMTIEIKGSVYSVTYRPGDKEVILEKDRGAGIYAVTEGTERTTCTCPDFEKRHAPLPHSSGCKHVRACVDAGLLRNVMPWDNANETNETNEAEAEANEWNPGPEPMAEEIEAQEREIAAVYACEARVVEREQEFVAAYWSLAFGDIPAPTLADLGCVRKDGTIDSDLMWDNLIKAKECHRHETRGPRFTLASEMKPTVKTRFRTTEVATRLLDMPLWTRRHRNLAEQIEARISMLPLPIDENEEQHTEIQAKLAAAVREYDRIMKSDRLPTTDELARVFNAALPAPRAPQGRAQRAAARDARQANAEYATAPSNAAQKAPRKAPSEAAGTSRRGRKPKYEHIDWQAVAARNEAGESRRKLADELGVPQSVVGDKIRKFQASIA